MSRYEDFKKFFGLRDQGDKAKEQFAAGEVAEQDVIDSQFKGISEIPDLDLTTPSTLKKERKPQNIKKNANGTFTVTVEGQKPQVLTAEQFASLQEQQQQKGQFGTSIPEVEGAKQARSGIVQQILNLTSSSEVGNPIVKQLEQNAELIAELLQGIPESTIAPDDQTIRERTAQRVTPEIAVDTIISAANSGDAKQAAFGAQEDIARGIAGDRAEAIAASKNNAIKAVVDLQRDVSLYQQGYLTDTQILAANSRAQQTLVDERAKIKNERIGLLGNQRTDGQKEEARINDLLRDIIPSEEAKIFAIMNQIQVREPTGSSFVGSENII